MLITTTIPARSMSGGYARHITHSITRGSAVREWSTTVHDLQHLQPQMRKVYETARKGLEAGPVVVALRRPNRSLDQNAKMWAMLTVLSREAEHAGERLSAEDWKNLITGSIAAQRPVPGLSGGVVFLGKSTSRMSKGEFSELIEYIYTVGIDHGIEWDEDHRPDERS